MGPIWGRQDPGGPNVGPHEPSYLGIGRVVILLVRIISNVMPQSYYHVLAATLYLRCWHPRFEEIGVDFGWFPRCVTMYYVVATI